MKGDSCYVCFICFDRVYNLMIFSYNPLFLPLCMFPCCSGGKYENIYIRRRPYTTTNAHPTKKQFLILSCPKNRGEDLSQCQCEIGIGNSQDVVPDTPTCQSCSFCDDGSLSYNCNNAAQGTCVGRTCDGTCIVSTDISSSAGRTSLTGTTMTVSSWSSHLPFVMTMTLLFLVFV